MTDGELEVVSRVDLRHELLPVAVFGSDAEELDVRSARIVHVAGSSPQCERFCLELLDEGGHLLESLAFETLAIATDQALAVLGVEPTEWASAGLSG